MASRNVINNKKCKGSEDRKYYYELISEANVACSRASESDVLPPDTKKLMEQFQNWLLVSSLGIFTPLLSVTTFFLKGAYIEIEEKKMKQPIVVWSANVSPPGCKKTPIYKLICENVECFSKHYKRNFEKYNINDIMWGGGTTEALKKSLGDTKLTDGCALIVSNELNSILDDMDKYNGSKGGDINFFCDLYDSIGLRRKTKCDGDIHVEKTNVSMCGK